MKTYRLFDVLGPTMIGPSSSHTAGAVKLGRVARALSVTEIKKVEFQLHGSFAMTYKGHGTDRALLAGLMGFATWSEDIKNALEIATDRGIEYDFIPIDLGDVHPNTVRIVVTDDKGAMVSLTGSSIGGGNIQITAINRDQVNFTGDYPTLIVGHTDIRGVIAKVTNALSEGQINIAFMKVFRSSRGRGATMVFETDEPVTQDVIDAVKVMPGIDMVSYLNLQEVE